MSLHWYLVTGVLFLQYFHRRGEVERNKCWTVNSKCSVLKSHVYGYTSAFLKWLRRERFGSAAKYLTTHSSSMLREVTMNVKVDSWSCSPKGSFGLNSRHFSFLNRWNALALFRCSSAYTTPTSSNLSARHAVTSADIRFRLDFRPQETDGRGEKKQKATWFGVGCEIKAGGRWNQVMTEKKKKCLQNVIFSSTIRNGFYIYTEFKMWCIDLPSLLRDILCHERFQPNSPLHRRSQSGKKK